MKYITILLLALSLSVCSTFKPAEKETPFTVNFRSPRIAMGSFEAQFDKLIVLLDVKKSKVTLDYYPLEDAVCLQYRIDFTTFYQYFSKEGRAIFLKALEQYKDDYEKKALSTTGSKKTRQKYGKFQSYLIWQSFQYTIRSQAVNDVEFGYDIKKVSNNRVSFFTIYRKDAIFESELAKNDDRRTAPSMPMYLTRAQAEELAEFFNEDYLKSIAASGDRKIHDDTIDIY